MSIGSTTPGEAPRNVRRRPWKGPVLALLACVGLAALVVWQAALRPGQAGWLLRPTLIHVVSPEPGTVVGLAGMDVIVRFPDAGRVRAETFRALLNGADVTQDFTTAGNGAYARLSALLDGENVLRVEVFGEGWWPPGVLLEDTREVRVLLRRPVDLDRG